MKGEAGSVGGEAEIPRMRFASNNPLNVSSEEKKKSLFSQ